MAVHRATLKKKQKGFKSRHSSKGSIKTANKGRIEKDGNNGTQKHTMSKLERKNLAKQIQSSKKANVAEKHKVFEGKAGAPRNVVFVPLSPDIERANVLQWFTTALEGEPNQDISNVFSAPRFRQSLRLFMPAYDKFYDLLDAAAAADFVVFILSANTEIDDYGESIVRCISSQGVTTCFGTIYGLDEVDNVKQQAGVRSSLTVWFQHFFPDVEKLQRLDAPSEAAITVRNICQKSPKGVHWRDERSYVVAEKIDQPLDGNLAVQGIVRGQTLSADQWVHVPGVGDLQIARVVEVPNKSQVDVEPKVWEPSPEQDSLEEELADEDMESESEDEGEHLEGNGVRMDDHHYVNEMIEADMGEGVTTIKNVPKGMSDYQASWLLEGEDYGLDEDASEDENLDDMLEGEEGELVDDGKMQDSKGAASESESESEQGDADEDDAMQDAAELSDEEENRQLKQFRERAKDDLEFPDEIELDPTESAKERLHRYRGLRGLREARWNPNEKDERAPEEYSTLCRPGNLVATKNFVAKRSQGGAQIGTRVVIYFNGRGNDEVIANYALNISTNGSALAVFGLLPFEHKTAQMNTSLIPDSEFTEPLKSKAPIVVQYGPRRLLVEPLYSQPGCNHDNGVYKFFRYLQPGHAATVSSMAPVMLGSNPVMYFTTESTPRLIGTGSTMDADSRRVIVKTAILTGHPLKIHKKLVTIRYMFFNPEDVAWFKAVPLFTRWGCNGYIKESLGTHGYFKATFDKTIKASDSISMALYKREYPKLATPFEPSA